MLFIKSFLLMDFSSRQELICLMNKAWKLLRKLETMDTTITREL